MQRRLGVSLVGGTRNYFWLAAIVVLGLDQLTKNLFAVAGASEVPLIPSFLRLIPHGANPRGAFSWGPEWAPFYIVATVIGLGVVGWFFLAARDGEGMLFTALGCVAGGAIGNLIDRAVLGGVRDFIDLHWMDRAHWPIFNLADVGICVGVGLLIWHTFRHSKEDRTRVQLNGRQAS